MRISFIDILFKKPDSKYEIFYDFSEAGRSIEIRYNDRVLKKLFEKFFNKRIMKRFNMKNADLQNLRTESASLQVGKSGITETLIAELNDRLKKNEMIKIKFLRNSPFNSRKEAFTALESKIRNKFSILETRGWTIIVKKNS